MGGWLNVLLASTEGCELSANRDELRCLGLLGGATGTAKFGFRDGRLYRLEVEFPNSKDTELRVAGALDRTLGERKIERRSWGASSGVGTLATMALLLPMLVIERLATEQPSAPRGEPFIRGEWHTPSTDAVLSAPGDGRTLVLQPQARK